VGVGHGASIAGAEHTRLGDIEQRRFVPILTAIGVKSPLANVLETLLGALEVLFGRGVTSL